MQPLWKITLDGSFVDMIGKPIADGIEKDIIKFANHAELCEGDYVETKLDKILSDRARGKQ